MKEKKIKNEADFFSKHDNELTRKRGWTSIEYFQKMIRVNFDMKSEVQKIIKDKNPIRCLTLACGDMVGEYNFFKSIGGTEIDAFDISEGQRENFYKKTYDGKVKVNYKIHDVNNIILEENLYDIVYMQQSYHHIEKVEHVANEINKSLKSTGILLLNDYVGEPFLQRTKKQREICSQIWKMLPPQYRKNPNGVVLDKIHIPKKETLSPYEAICSDKIIPTLKNTFLELKSFYFGGILFPIFNGFTTNYKNNESDNTLIKLMWEIDQILIKNSVVEPNFIRGIFKKRI